MAAIKHFRHWMPSAASPGERSPACSSPSAAGAHSTGLAAEADRADLLDRTAVEAQDSYRWPFTARINVATDRPDVPHDEDLLQTAAQYSGIDETIASLPRGWDTLLARGYKGGHRSRADSGSASASPEPATCMPRSSSSTKPPAPSTPRPSRHLLCPMQAADSAVRGSVFGRRRDASLFGLLSPAVRAQADIGGLHRQPAASVLRLRRLRTDNVGSVLSRHSFPSHSSPKFAYSMARPTTLRGSAKTSAPSFERASNSR